MADLSSTIKLNLSAPGIYHTSDLKQETADKVSKLCNENHTLRHCFYNEIGDVFEHNHIVHHLFTLFSMGAKPEIVEEMYKRDIKFQLLQPPKDEVTLKNLHDPAIYMAHVADHMHYPNYLRFFESEIASLGVEQVVQRYVFGGDEIAEDMFGRLFHGFVHPLIHFGLGLDFEQPAIVAESLAQAVAHHDQFVTDALRETEKMSNARIDHANLVDLFLEASTNEKILASRRFSTWEKLSQGTLAHAKHECVDIASKWIVKASDEDIALKAAEIMNASVYSIAATQRPDKLPRIDFLLLHLPNAAIFMCMIAKLRWLSNEHKARILSWYGRMMVILFATFGARSNLSLSAIRSLKPLGGGYADAIKRGINHPDDGHGVKLVRSIIFAAEISKPYEDRPEFAVQGEDFLKIMRAVVESFNPQGGKAGANLAETWIRGVAFDEAWADVPNKGEQHRWLAKGEEVWPEGIKVHDWVSTLKPTL